MRACGIGLNRIAKPIFIFAIVMACVSFVLNETVVPVMTKQSTDLALYAFSKKNIPEGKHILVCSYIAYQKQRIPVDKQTPLPITISLTEDNLTLQEVTVTTQRRQDTETAMLQGVKSTLSVASGISASQIARTGDTNAAGHDTGKTAGDR